jgi:polyhydroxybutyrate depolymerase
MMTLILLQARRFQLTALMGLSMAVACSGSKGSSGTAGSTGSSSSGATTGTTGDATTGTSGASVGGSVGGTTGEPTVYAYDTETLTITSNAKQRAALIAKPSPAAAGPLPLVIALHGDGGNSAGMRGSLSSLEQAAAHGAVFAYPKSIDAAFEYYTLAGRNQEALYVSELIDKLVADGLADRSKVILTGHSGGATMLNAITCILGRTVIAATAPMAGSLYEIDDKIGTPPATIAVPAPADVTSENCQAPPALVIWGEADLVAGTDYCGAGVSTTNIYLTQNGCDATVADEPRLCTFNAGWSSAVNAARVHSTATTPNPCLDYNGCDRRVRWCSIPDMGHSVWSEAGAAIWAFWTQLN